MAVILSVSDRGTFLNIVPFVVVDNNGQLFLLLFMFM